MASALSLACHLLAGTNLVNADIVNNPLIPTVHPVMSPASDSGTYDNAWWSGLMENLPQHNYTTRQMTELNGIPDSCYAQSSHLWNQGTASPSNINVYEGTFADSPQPLMVCYDTTSVDTIKLPLGTVRNLLWTYFDVNVSGGIEANLVPLGFDLDAVKNQIHDVRNNEIPDQQLPIGGLWLDADPKYDRQVGPAEQHPSASRQADRISKRLYQYHVYVTDKHPADVLDAVNILIRSARHHSRPTNNDDHHHIAIDVIHHGPSTAVVGLYRPLAVVKCACLVPSSDLELEWKAAQVETWTGTKSQYIVRLVFNLQARLRFYRS